MHKGTYHHSKKIRKKISESLRKFYARPIITKDCLYRLYLIKNKTDRKIALLYRVKRRYIKYLRHKFNIFPTPEQISLRKSRAVIGEKNPNFGKRGKKHHFFGKRKERCHNWKGGIYHHPEGYTYIFSPDHPFHNAANYVYEHRLIIEKKLGRFLQPHEACHHINKIKDDNRPENLMAFKNHSIHRRFEQGRIIPPEEIIFDGHKFHSKVS